MRQFLLVATLFFLIGMTVGTMVVIGSVAALLRADSTPTPPAVTPPTHLPTIAVFNMAEVMKNYRKANYQDNLLNEERKKLMADVVRLRKEYIELQKELGICGGGPSVKEETEHDSFRKRSIKLVQQLEDKDRELNELNEKVNASKSSVYDDIKIGVAKLAELNAYDVVFAYNDATCPEEMENPSWKKLTLKPVLLHPFFAAQHIDITGNVIQALNSWEAYSLPPVQPKSIK
jgi:Skp family chaperone for outer membrane proteins